MARRRAGEWRLTNWNGPKIVDDIRGASADAVNKTLQNAADQAASGRSGRVANVQVVEQASDSGLTGRWGVPPEPGGDPFYELFHETGTAFLPGDGAKRRAADNNYRALAGLIRDGWGG